MGPARSRWAAGASFFTWISSRGFIYFSIYFFIFLVSSPVFSAHESAVWKQQRSLVGELIRKRQRQLRFCKVRVNQVKWETAAAACRAAGC